MLYLPDHMPKSQAVPAKVEYGFTQARIKAVGRFTPGESGGIDAHIGQLLSLVLDSMPPQEGLMRFARVQVEPVYGDASETEPGLLGLDFEIEFEPV